MSNSETKEQRREKRILDAASELIVRFGYDKTTVREIADAAGVSKGAIYLHFDSKRALFEGLLLREFRLVSRAWLDSVEADEEAGSLGSMYRAILSAQHESELMMAIYRQDPKVLGSYLHAEDNIFERAYSQSVHVRFVEQMQAAGVIRQDVDAQVISHVMDIVDYGFVSIGELKEPEQIPSHEETIELIGQMLDRALTPAEGVDREKGRAVIRRLIDEYDEILAQLMGQGDE